MAPTFTRPMIWIGPSQLRWNGIFPTMWQIINKTPFPAQLAFTADPDGMDTAIAVVKATFTISPDAVMVARVQSPVITADTHWGDPSRSSIRYACETGFPKLSTDIVMNGHAWAPCQHLTKQSYVRLAVGQYSKIVDVYGLRYWDKAFGIRTKIGPLPFDKIALRYENAYGGSDVHKSNPENIQNEACNPVGKGFRMKGSCRPLKGFLLPNLEGGNPPAGFGYISPAWLPRVKYAGTYDAVWQKERAPRLPEDFDRRFFNCAHPDLITNSYLTGGEPVVIENATPDGMLTFALPKLVFGIDFVFNGQARPQPAFMDTLIIEPDENRFCMIWRASTSCDKTMLKLNSVRVTCVDSDLNLKVRSDA